MKFISALIFDFFTTSAKSGYGEGAKIGKAKSTARCRRGAYHTLYQI